MYIFKVFILFVLRLYIHQLLKQGFYKDKVNARLWNICTNKNLVFLLYLDMLTVYSILLGAFATCIYYIQLCSNYVTQIYVTYVYKCKWYCIGITMWLLCNMIIQCYAVLCIIIYTVGRILSEAIAKNVTLASW